MNQNKVEIVAIVDRSGSMYDIKNDAEGGLNTFIKDQREKIKDKDVIFTLAQFDTEYELIYNGVNINDVRYYTLSPRGGTALLDAIGRTMNAVGTRLANTPEEDRPGRVLVLIVTDGQENSSREFKSDKIKEMIDLQTIKYSWEFIYLCADDFSKEEGAALGIKSYAGFSGYAGYADMKSNTSAYYNNVSIKFTSAVNNARAIADTMDDENV